MDESAENLSRIKSNTEARGPVRRTEDKRNEETSDESISFRLFTQSSNPSIFRSASGAVGERSGDSEVKP